MEDIMKCPKCGAKTGMNPNFVANGIPADLVKFMIISFSNRRWPWGT
jgi:hypothetical protein